MKAKLTILRVPFQVTESEMLGLPWIERVLRSNETYSRSVLGTLKVLPGTEEDLP